MDRRGSILKITIKTRVWLLGLVVLGGMLALLVLHFRMSATDLGRNAELVELLRQTGHFSRTIHELQRERGLSSSYLAGREELAFADLQAQYAATDFKLRELRAALPEGKDPLVTVDVMRRRVAAGDVSQREAFDYYTLQVAAMLERVVQLAQSAGGHPMQSGLIAHAHLVQAKEFLGQSRATLLALPADGKADPAWNAAMGRHIGLYDWHVALFLRGADEDLASTLGGALSEPDMLRARQILVEAQTNRTLAVTPAARRDRYEAMTAAIDLLREVERYSLADLQEKAEAAQAAGELAAMLERAGLLLVSGLLVYLALTSLRQVLNALETALMAARRAARSLGEAAVPAPARQHDEVGEISRGFGDLLELVDRLNRKASTDALTEALNRHGFAEIAVGELLRARRYRRSLSMIVFDLDHFKAINDRHGHAAGDLVLQVVARLVRDNLRLADVFARWGGEEFVILAPETSGEEAERLAEKLRLLFREHRGAGVPGFSASFGIAALAPDDDLDSLFARADRALYQAKQAGRDRVVLHQPEKSTATDARRRITVVADNTRRGTTS